MPSQTSSQSLLASIPSFMSVFGASPDIRGRKGGDATETNASNGTTTVHNERLAHSNDFLSRIPRRGSSSTCRSDSTDSSPTTTISTLDSSLTEPSPSSSPESPTSIIPLGPFESLKASSSSPRDAAMDPPLSPLPNLPGFNRGDSPGRKRNTKNLSLNTSASHKPAAQPPRMATSGIQGTDTAQPLHAPTSPSFIMPSKPPARRPSSMGLCLSTKNSSAQSLAAQSGLSLVPQTPYGSHPTLRNLHLASSLPLFSPTAAPEGGMQLPPFGNTSTTGRFVNSRPPLNISQNPSHSYNSIYSSPLAVQTLDHVQEEVDYDPPLSREVRSPAYPKGPVCIYEPYVYLYLEPSVGEASEFDVIINVAREVKNPFMSISGETDAFQAKDSATQTYSDEDVPMALTDQDIPEPLTAVSGTSFQSAIEMQSEAVTDANLMTPKASRPEPEYIHIPWEHNTNVVDDLLKLCELIDDRVQHGKRVLVHCQCGVSRSASLIVAYGLFKKPELTVQQAYDAVKDRSRWIGPNMNLIYQLSEFKSIIPQRTFFPAASVWRSLRSFGHTRSPSSGVSTPNSKSTFLSASLSNGQSEPLSAPLPYEKDLAPARANSLSPPTTAHLVGSLELGDVSPGPSSAPPDMYTGMMLDLSTEAKGTEDPATRKSVQSIPTSNPIHAEPEEMPPTGDSPADPNHAKTLPELTVDTEAAQSIASSSLRLKTPAPQTSELAEPTLSPSTSLALPGGRSSVSLKRSIPRFLPLRDQSPPSEHPTIRAQYAKTSIDHVMSDDCSVPETPSLLSPRAAEFTASPFPRTAAGDLAGSSVFEQASKLEKGTDPRSPASRGEAPIVRTIDDLI